MTPPSDSQPIAVLLVEDDPGDVVLIQEAFEHNKVRNRLHVVGDGVEAMEFLRNGGERPDLVLLDLNLPRRSSARSTSSSSPSSSSRLTRRQVKNGVRRKGAAGLAHFLRDW